MAYYICTNCGHTMTAHELTSRTVRENHIDRYVEERRLPACPYCDSVCIERIPPAYYSEHGIDVDDD